MVKIDLKENSGLCLRVSNRLINTLVEAFLFSKALDEHCPFLAQPIFPPCTGLIIVCLIHKMGANGWIAGICLPLGSI